MITFWEINKNIWIYLNNFVIENNLEKMVGLFADLPIFFLPIFLSWLWLFHSYIEKNEEKKSNLLNIFYSTILAICISLIIQQIITIDRPESIVKPLIKHIPDASFPSDHASVSFAFLFSILFAWYKKVFYTFISFVIIMNLSRLSWWIHWFFDIIVWALVWILSSIITFKILKENSTIKKINKKIIKLFKIIKL